MNAPILRPLMQILPFLAAALACSRPGRPGHDAAVDQAAATLAIYMPGGNLEDSVAVRGSWQEDEGHVLPPGQRSRLGAASDDLRELMAAYRALSPEARNRIGGWVAFGGARKVGWRGIRYADLPCLALDASDGLFGDASCYAFVDGDADMSRSETLARFLGYVRSRQPAKGLNLLVLWGQGGAHEGYGYDSVHQEIPFMRLPDLRAAFARSGARFAIIGMDAPLMASLEVVDTVRPFAPLLVASPDRAPTHGWDYGSLIRHLAQTPAPDGRDLAVAVADEFFDRHPSSRDKAISIVDTTRAPAVAAALDALMADAEPVWPQVMTAFAEAPYNGRETVNDIVESVDVTGLADRIATLAPTLSARSSTLVRAVDEAVIHSRQDEGHLWPSRLSIFSPLMAKLWSGSYEAGTFLTPGWRGFIGRSIARLQADQRPPVIIKKGNRTLEIRDDTGIRSVSLVQAQRAGDVVWRIWHSRELPVRDRSEQGRVRRVNLEAIEQQDLWLCSGPCRPTAARARVPTHLVGSLPSGTQIFTAPAIIRDLARKTDGEEATLFVEVHPTDGVTDAWVAPFQSDTDGRVLFSREQYRLSQGLSVAFSVLEREESGPSEMFRKTDYLDLDQPPHWELVGPVERLTARIAVTDLRGNRTFWPIADKRRAQSSRARAAGD